MKILAAQRLEAATKTYVKRKLLRSLLHKARVEDLMLGLKKCLDRPSDHLDPLETLAMRGDVRWQGNNRAVALSYTLSETAPTYYTVHVANYGVDLVFCVEGDAQHVQQKLEDRLLTAQPEQHKFLKQLRSAFRQAR